MHMYIGIRTNNLNFRQKKAQKVYANDLNPESFRWLKHNAQANKVADRMELHNMDGREFIQSVVRDVILKRLNQARKFFSLIYIPTIKCTY